MTLSLRDKKKTKYLENQRSETEVYLSLLRPEPRIPLCVPEESLEWTPEENHSSPSFEVNLKDYMVTGMHGTFTSKYSACPCCSSRIFQTPPPLSQQTLRLPRTVLELTQPPHTKCMSMVACWGGAHVSLVGEGHRRRNWRVSEGI